MNGKQRYAWISGGAALAVAAALLSVGTLTPAFAQSDGDASVKVGIYQPQQVFDRYPDREEMMGQMEEIQGQMQEASQNGDQQQMAELQQQMQQARNEAIQQFQRDVEEAVPTVAQEQDVDLVATEVVYSGDHVETTDITNDVIEELGGEPASGEEQMMIPGQGQQGQGQQGQGQQGQGQQGQGQQGQGQQGQGQR